MQRIAYVLSKCGANHEIEFLIIIEALDGMRLRRPSAFAEIYIMYVSNIVEYWSLPGKFVGFVDANTSLAPRILNQRKR